MRKLYYRWEIIVYNIKQKVGGGNMASFYTHAYFGELVEKQLPSHIGEIVKKYPELYYIGLQGPDILFFYRGYYSNKITKIGFGQHKKPGKEFFIPALEILRTCRNQEAGLSYLAGFICHFTLDSAVHPYIDTVEKEKGLSHAEIEAETDRYLMIQENLDYLRYVGADQVVCSSENAEIISWFWKDISAKEIKVALQYMKRINRLFCAPGKIKRHIVYGGLRIIGQYNSLKGMIINYNENELCKENTEHIVSLCHDAVMDAVALIKEYEATMTQEGDTLNERYNLTFGV